MQRREEENVVSVRPWLCREEKKKGTGCQSDFDCKICMEHNTGNPKCPHKLSAGAKMREVVVTKIPVIA